MSPGGGAGLDNLGKKYAMDPKIHLAEILSALDVRNHCLACFSERFMLRLIPQLLRSSEIQLFKDQAPLYRGFPLYSLLNPYVAQVRI